MGASEAAAIDEEREERSERAGESEAACEEKSERVGECEAEGEAERVDTAGEAGEFLAFAQREQFVAWLAGQSDLSLSGLDLPQEWLRANQRLSLARLRAFLD